MQTLRPQTPEVPHHVRVFQVGLRIALLGVDEGRELHGVRVTGQCKPPAQITGILHTTK